MNRIRTGVSLVLLTFVLASFLTLSCGTAQQGSTTAAAEDPIERGKYLVGVGGCNDCHTPGYLYGAPDMNRMLSGSEVGWAGPWGIAFARNLTPDPETGIGNWTEDQIMTAIRTGNTPDGRQLAPIMPWMGLGATLNDDDARAIAKYLKSIPPVTHKNVDLVPPDTEYKGAIIHMPPPPAWDVPPATN